MSEFFELSKEAAKLMAPGGGKFLVAPDEYKTRTDRRDGAMYKQWPEQAIISEAEAKHDPKNEDRDLVEVVLTIDGTGPNHGRQVRAWWRFNFSALIGGDAESGEYKMTRGSGRRLNSLLQAAGFVDEVPFESLDRVPWQELLGLAVTVTVEQPVDQNQQYARDEIVFFAPPVI